MCVCIFNMSFSHVGAGGGGRLGGERSRLNDRRAGQRGFKLGLGLRVYGSVGDCLCYLGFVLCLVLFFLLHSYRRGFAIWLRGGGSLGCPKTLEPYAKPLPKT